MKKSRTETKAEPKQRLINRKRRIQYRLRDRVWTEQAEPMFTARNIHYELADRTRGLGPGGIGAMHLLARRTGLIEAIDRRLHLLKVHLPYHESDHVLNIAYNILAGGTCLEDIEQWRNDEVYLDALGARRIPDPATAGDFRRRFHAIDIEILMNTINDVRVKVWQQQPAEFLEEAIIEGDGLMAETTGRCKEGMDINYKGQWGYHPLLISLANTSEPLYLVNRRGNRPSHEGAAARFDQAIAPMSRAREPVDIARDIRADRQSSSVIAPNVLRSGQPSAIHRSIVTLDQRSDRSPMASRIGAGSLPPDRIRPIVAGDTFSASASPRLSSMSGVHGVSLGQ